MKQKLNQQQEMKPRSSFRDIWQLIIKLIIALLIIAWFVKEFLQSREVDFITLLILIILLAFIIWLIIRQRHIIKLYCKITSPTGCVNGDPNILSGMVLEPIGGNAYGLGFSHYLIEVKDPGGNLLSDVIIYPDNSGNPGTTLTQGDYPKVGATLGWIDVEKAVNDAGIILLTSTTFELTLRVFDVIGGEKNPSCLANFTVSVNEVYIKRVSTPWSFNFSDPNEPLRLSDSGTADLATIGGNMHIRGAADVYGCSGEKIDEYTIWAIPDSNFSFSQPPPLTVITPQPNWVQVTYVEFKSQTIDGNVFTADDVRAYNVLDADPNPDVLTNTWGTRKECICVHIDSTIVCNCWKVPDLKAKAFNSNSAFLPYKLDPSHLGGTGKFTFLLQLIDTSGNQYYDIQRAWIDNEKEVAKITGISGLLPCQDLYTKDSKGNFKTVDIEGTAWDALIDPSGPDLSKPTSDNFDKYIVKFQKQGAASEAELITSHNTVPARPAPVGVGVLTPWDLESLNMTTNPLSLPADQLLTDGESCTYDVILRVWDLTIVNEGSPGTHYSGKITFPMKIINAQQP